MEESIVERVLILMKEYELSASEFADKIDVQRSSMSHLVSGRNKPSLDFIQKILNNFSDINPTWLIMGTGPMKQLDLFDIKGDVAPIQPIPAENFRTEVPTTAQQGVSKNSSEDDSSNISDIKKVVYAQSAPTVTVTPETIIPVQKEALKEEHLPAAAASVPIPPIPATATPVPLSAPQATSPSIPSEVPVSPPAVVNQQPVSAEKSASNDKKVVKIVFFYSDNTFETFNPQ